MAAEGTEHGPLDQFIVSPIFELPELFGIDLSITNSALFMLLAFVVSSALFIYAMRKRATVPGRAQSMAEITYQFVQGIVEENTGRAGLKYFPFIFTLFLFILFMNMLSLIPYSFAPTSHIVVTFGMGAFVFLAITIIAIIKQGPIGFLKHFVPEGLPFYMVPLIFPIEIISYLARPVSLGIRLAANMAAGHMLLFVIASFVAPLAYFGIFPIIVLVGITGFELFVAILQAYVFTLLSCLYLSEALAEHH